jgi:hypothetical protein
MFRGGSDLPGDFHTTAALRISHESWDVYASTCKATHPPLRGTFPEREGQRPTPLRCVIANTPVSIIKGGMIDVPGWKRSPGWFPYHRCLADFSRKLGCIRIHQQDDPSAPEMCHREHPGKYHKTRDDRCSGVEAISRVISIPPLPCGFLTKAGMYTHPPARRPIRPCGAPSLRGKDKGQHP